MIVLQMHRRYIGSYTLRLQSGISLAINLVDISKSVNR